LYDALVHAPRLPAGRARCPETTVAEQRAHNVHVHDGIGEQDFVAMRQKRDAGLEKPGADPACDSGETRDIHLSMPRNYGTKLRDTHLSMPNF